MDVIIPIEENERFDKTYACHYNCNFVNSLDKNHFGSSETIDFCSNCCINL